MIISRLTTAFRCLHRFQKSPTVIRVIRNHTRDLSTDDDAFDTQFGKRHLEDEQRVFQQNAWDDVRWDEDLLNEAKEKTRLLNSQFMSKEESDELERNAADRWNQFYANHAKGFFRERSWLFRVFPDLREALEKIEVKDGDKVAIQPSSSRHSTQVKVLEVGCGPGSAVIPLLQNPLSRRMLLYCCDFSDIAIDMLKNNEAYDRDLCRAFQWDITDTKREIPIQDGSLGMIKLIACSCFMFTTVLMRFQCLPIDEFDHSVLPFSAFFVQISSQSSSFSPPSIPRISPTSFGVCLVSCVPAVGFYSGTTADTTCLNCVSNPAVPLLRTSTHAVMELAFTFSRLRRSIIFSRPLVSKRNFFAATINSPSTENYS